MSTVHNIVLKDSVFDDLTEICLSVYRSGEKANVIQLMENMMNHSEVPMHYPYHHFILPAALLTVVALDKNDKTDSKLREELLIARERAKQVPGGFCGNCGACGAGIGAGIFMSVYTQSSPMSVQTWQWCNEITSACLKNISSVAGPRCCKRVCFLSVQAAVSYIKEKLGISLCLSESIHCRYSELNSTCKKNDCPFYK